MEKTKYNASEVEVGLKQIKDKWPSVDLTQIQSYQIIKKRLEKMNEKPAEIKKPQEDTTRSKYTENELLEVAALAKELYNKGGKKVVKAKELIGAAQKKFHFSEDKARAIVEELVIE